MSIYSPYYVYAYVSKTSGLPYYIGKGKGRRAYVKNGRAVLPPDNKALIIFMETNLTEIGAYALERRYIQWYGRRDNNTGILLNRTEGGEYIANGGARKNRKHSEETKLKMSKAAKGRTPWTKGKPRSEETKRKIGEANSNPSKEARQKMSEAHKGKIRSEEHRKNLSLALKGRTVWNKGKKYV